MHRVKLSTVFKIEFEQYGTKRVPTGGELVLKTRNGQISGSFDEDGGKGHTYTLDDCDFDNVSDDEWLKALIKGEDLWVNGQTKATWQELMGRLI